MKESEEYPSWVANQEHKVNGDFAGCQTKNKKHSYSRFLFSDDFCQPLGDQNVWGTLYTIKEPLKEREVVMLATKVLKILIL